MPVFRRNCDVHQVLNRNSSGFFLRAWNGADVCVFVKFRADVDVKIDLKGSFKDGDAVGILAQQKSVCFYPLTSFFHGVLLIISTHQVEQYMELVVLFVVAGAVLYKTVLYFWPMFTEDMSHCPEPAESVVSKQHQADDISTNDSYTDDTMDQVMKEQSDVMTAHATNGKFYTTGAGAAVATAYQDTTEHTLFDKVGTSDFND